MKKFILLFTLIVFSSFILSGDIKTLDFTNQTNYQWSFQEGNAIRFDFKGMDNKIVVRKIDPLEKRIDITVFVEGAEVPFYQAVSSKFKIDLDFDRDDVNDMEVRLYGFQKNNTGVLLVNGLSSFEKEEETVTSTFAFCNLWDFEKLKSYFKTYLLYVILGALVLLLLIVERRTILKSYRRIKRGFRI